MKNTVLLAFALVAPCAAMAQSEPNPEAWWARPGPDGVQRVNVRCGVDYIDPAEIVLRVGAPAELAVSAPADLPAQTFTARLPRLQSPAVDLPLAAQQRRVAFVPGLMGQFRMACRDDSPTGGGRQTGGKLTVIP